MRLPGNAPAMSPTTQLAKSVNRQLARAHLLAATSLANPDTQGTTSNGKENGRRSFNAAYPRGARICLSLLPEHSSPVTAACDSGERDSALAHPERVFHCMER